MHIMTGNIARNILIMTVIGAFVCAQQISAESVFTTAERGAVEALAGRPIVLINASLPPIGICALSFSGLGADTVETFDVEVDEEEGAGIGKQLAVFAIITAVVAYAVIELMKTDDSEPAKDTGSGKPVPFSRIGAPYAVPLTPSR